MKIMFVENKYKTAFWEIIANSLSEAGHQIVWLVQNARFTPKIGLAHVIPYPKNLTECPPPSTDLKDIVDADRALNHFGATETRHFSYYHNLIERVLQEEQPDLVFGECTLFHELLTISLCRKHNILYLHPCTCRYPNGRFSFYLYNTLEPFGGEGLPFSNDQAEEFVLQLTQRTVQPDYIQPKHSPQTPRLEQVKKFSLNAAEMSLGYAQGERYNLPSPLKKIQIEWKRTRLKKQWEQLVEKKQRRPFVGNFTLLYPMQLQPEANIDVWGSRYKDQTALIKNLLTVTDPDTRILIKPNPKAKYELNTPLLKLIERHDRLQPISLHTSMDDTLKHTDLILTVTGTIALEAVFSNHPVVTLARTLNNQNANCPYIPALAHLPRHIDAVRNGQFPTLSFTKRVDFLQKIVRTSYPGLIGDPFNSPIVKSTHNLQQVSHAFFDIIEHWKALQQFELLSRAARIAV